MLQSVTKSIAPVERLVTTDVVLARKPAAAATSSAAAAPAAAPEKQVPFPPLPPFPFHPSPSSLALTACCDRSGRTGSRSGSASPSLVACAPCVGCTDVRRVRVCVRAMDRRPLTSARVCADSAKSAAPANPSLQYASPHLTSPHRLRCPALPCPCPALPCPALRVSCADLWCGAPNRRVSATVRCVRSTAIPTVRCSRAGPRTSSKSLKAKTCSQHSNRLKKCGLLPRPLRFHPSYFALH